MKYYTTAEACKILGISQARITVKIRNGHFPNSKKCECGSKSWLIREDDLEKQGLKRKAYLNYKKSLKD